MAALRSVDPFADEVGAGLPEPLGPERRPEHGGGACTRALARLHVGGGVARQQDPVHRNTQRLRGLEHPLRVGLGPGHVAPRDEVLDPVPEPELDQAELGGPTPLAGEHADPPPQAAGLVDDLDDALDDLDARPWCSSW